MFLSRQQGSIENMSDFQLLGSSSLNLVLVGLSEAQNSFLQNEKSH